MSNLVERLRNGSLNLPVVRALETEAADEIERLEDLVMHCWIHSGYLNCGYAKMTSEQKALYDQLVSKWDADER